MELGCDARGYSRAGYEAHVWYCAVLAGRHGPELNKMREVSFFFVHVIELCFLILYNWYSLGTIIRKNFTE